MDIAIILDSSRTVGWNNFESLKRSLAKLVDYFHVSQEGTHFGVIRYNQNATLDVDFSDTSLHNPEILKERIMDLEYDPGLTRTDKAIELADEMLFSDRGGVRKDVPKLMVVVTDGRTGEGSTPYSSVLAPLKVTFYIKTRPEMRTIH